MTNYTFPVVATNSIGSEEAGVVIIYTPGEVIATAWVSTYDTVLLVTAQNSDWENFGKLITTSYCS